MFGSKRRGTVIAKGIKIVGSVTAEGLVEVNGQIDGELHCTSLIVSRGAHVTGTIAAGIGTAISYLGQMAFFFGGNNSDEEEGGGSPFGFVGMILLIILAPIAATIAPPPAMSDTRSPLTATPWARVSPSERSVS